MGELTRHFDAKLALARVSDMARRSAHPRSGGKRRSISPEDRREIIEILAEILIHSTIPLAHIAESIQVVPKSIYAETLGKIWGHSTLERRNDAIQWIETLLKGDANAIRCQLIPVIAAQDPGSARRLLPAKPNELTLIEDRERFAKNWLVGNIGPFENLLTGELVEHEVTRVLRVLLRLSIEPAVSDLVRAQSIRLVATALMDHQLAQTKTGLEPIFLGMAQLVADLPSAESSTVVKYLCDYAGPVASRLRLSAAATLSPKEVAVPSEHSALPISEIAEESPEPRTLSAELEAMSLATDLDRPGSPVQFLEGGQPSEGELTTPPPVAEHDDGGLIAALETRAREHRESAFFLGKAATQLKAAAATIAEFEATIASLERAGEVREKSREAMERRFESLSKDLTRKDNDLHANTEELRRKGEAIQNLERSNNSLSSQLSEARDSASTAQLRLDASTASHKNEMETLVHRVAGQTDQQLEEFRNDLAGRISNILRGTPTLESSTAVDGKVILFRLWEIIEALKRKSIPIRTE